MSLNRVKLIVQGRQVPSAAPVNTVPPAISAPNGVVVGETLFCSQGTWDNSPTGFAYQWYKAGVAIPGANTPFYLVQEADAAAATQGLLRCDVAATNLADTTTASSLNTAMPRRTYAAIAYPIRSETLQNYGSVNWTNSSMEFVGTGATAPTSITTGTASSGVDAYWTKTALKTPKPSATGVANALAGGPHVFPLTSTFADGAVESSTVTITIVAGGYSFGDGDNLGTLYTAVGGTAASGKTFEMVVGASYSGVLSIYSWSFSSETFFQYADVTRPSVLLGLDLRADSNVTFVGLECAGAITAGMNARVYMASLSGTRCSNLKFDGFTCLSTPANVGSSQYVFRLAAVDGLILNNLNLEWGWGFVLDNAGGATNVTIDGFDGRYFHDNGMILGLADGPYTITNVRMASPMRFTGSGTHLDFIQVQGTAGAGFRMYVDKIIVCQADGDASCQGFFLGSSNKYTVEIRRALGAVRTNPFIQNSTGNNNVLEYITAWGTASGPVNTTSGENDDPYVFNGPYIRFTQNSTFWSGTNVLNDALIMNTVIQDFPAIWTITNVVQFNGTMSAPPTGAGYFAAAPMPILDAFDYANSDLDAIEAMMRNTLKPLPGAAVWGALQPSGDWRA